MEKILHEILAEDVTILARRDDLISALNEKVPLALKRDYTPIKKALELNVNEIFATGGSDRDAAKAEAAQILKDSGMSEARINFVVETFTKALGWDEPPAPVETTKIDTVKKNKLPASENSSAPMTDADITPAFAPEPPQETAKTVPTVVEIYNQANQNASQKIAEANPAVEEIIQQTSDKMAELKNSTGTSTTSFVKNHIDTIFTTKGRLNRLAYFLNGIKACAIILVGAIVSDFASLLGGIIILAGVIGGWMLGIRRLHDLDRSGWWMLIGFVPYVNFVFSLYIVFVKGTDGYNRYGADPLRE